MTGWKESDGKDNQYEILVKQQVTASKAEAAKDGVTVPTTLEDYVVKPPTSSRTKSSFDMSFLEDDDESDIMDNDLNESGEMVCSVDVDDAASSVGDLDYDQAASPSSSTQSKTGGEC